MDIRLASKADLPQLEAVYQDVINTMNKNKIEIWDEIYPCSLFEADIDNKCLYVLTESNTIISAFALCESSTGASSVKWMDNQGKALYLDRFAVNVNYLRKGIAQIMLQKAVNLAMEQSADYLRLFVVDINTPAIALYRRAGFHQAEGIYNEIIDETLTLQEYGFEIETI